MTRAHNFGLVGLEVEMKRAARLRAALFLGEKFF